MAILTNCIDMRPAKQRTLAELVIAYQKRSGRQDLPWQKTTDPYLIWLSEIMLQQTQVSTVIPYYQRFLSQFPTMQTLANARRDDVLSLWSGLGYYHRAHHLHEAAQIIRDQYHGQFPCNFNDLLQLPGIGRSTAGAIADFAFGANYPILDGNVKRLFARYFGIQADLSTSEVSKELWEIASKEMPAEQSGIYIQGLMDLGATVCRRSQPDCQNCPLQHHCRARKLDKVNQIPYKATRKAKGSQSIRFFIYWHANQVLLKQKPNKGIWAGLWSLPEKDLQISATLIQTKESLPAIHHTLTHLHLTLQPTRVQLTKASPIKETTWFGLKAALALGLPKPVRDLMLELQKVMQTQCR